MARIDIPSDSHSGSFSWLQYLKEDDLEEDDRQWKLVDAEQTEGLHNTIAALKH